MDSEISNTAGREERNPEPESSLLRKNNFGYLEDYLSSDKKPSFDQAKALKRSLIDFFDVSPQALKSFEVSKPRSRGNSENLSEEVYTAYATGPNKKTYFFYKDDFRTYPLLLIVTRDHGKHEGDLSAEVFSKGDLIEIDDPKLLDQIYKTLGDLHQTGARFFEKSI